MTTPQRARRLDSSELNEVTPAQPGDTLAPMEPTGRYYAWKESWRWGIAFSVITVGLLILNLALGNLSFWSMIPVIPLTIAAIWLIRARAFYVREKKAPLRPQGLRTTRSR